MDQIKRPSFLTYFLFFVMFPILYTGLEYLLLSNSFVFEEQLLTGVVVGSIMCFFIYFNAEVKLGNKVSIVTTLKFLAMTLIASNITGCLLKAEEYDWQKTSFVASITFVLMVLGMYLFIKPKKESKGDKAIDEKQ